MQVVAKGQKGRQLSFTLFYCHKTCLGKSNVYVICISSGLAIAGPCADVVEQLPLGCQAAPGNSPYLLKKLAIIVLDLWSLLQQNVNINILTSGDALVVLAKDHINGYHSAIAQSEAASAYRCVKQHCCLTTNPHRKLLVWHICYLTFSRYCQSVRRYIILNMLRPHTAFLGRLHLVIELTDKLTHKGKSRSHYQCLEFCSLENLFASTGTQNSSLLFPDICSWFILG